MVAGRPLISWTIAAARACSLVSRLIVSTDDTEIADVSRREGADVPFLRPVELAADETSSMDVVMHAVAWLRQHEHYSPDYLLLLQPTSPLRSAEDILASIEMVRSTGAVCVVSVRMLHPPLYWAKKIESGGRLSELLPDDLRSALRSGAECTCVPNGAIYLASCDWLLTNKTFYGADTYAHIMPDDRSLDVDTEWDLQVADLILRRQLTACHETN